jgi:hypothetical protein
MPPNKAKAVVPVVQIHSAKIRSINVTCSGSRKFRSPRGAAHRCTIRDSAARKSHNGVLISSRLLGVLIDLEIVSPCFLRDDVNSINS